MHTRVNCNGAKAEPQYIKTNGWELLRVLDNQYQLAIGVGDMRGKGCIPDVCALLA